MPPTGSIWTAVITAAAAFAGVLLAQWWTTRREERNFQRQLQMYSTQWDDQRERDREQREDQRRRDRELWDREDRHRFTDYKRDLYAEFLAYAIELRLNIAASAGLVEKEQERRKDAGEQPISSVRAYLRERHRDMYDKIRSDAEPTIEKISLVCPGKVDTLARRLTGKLLLAQAKVMIGDTERAKEEVMASVQLFDEFRDMARADLSTNDRAAQ